MFKKMFRYLAYRIYETGKHEAFQKQQVLRNELLNSSAILHPEAIIEEEAHLQNSQNDKTRITIGKKTQVRGHLMLFRHGGQINIGDYCFVGPQTKIWSAKKITIGNRVLISHNVNIHDNISHPLRSDDRHRDFVHIIKDGFQEKIDLRESEVVIGDDAWIGFNATILKGVTIGKGAIIGAGTIITDDVPDFAVVVGNPARIIKYTE